MRLCMSRLVELYRGSSCSLLILYVGVDRCVNSASAGKPRGFNYVCMTAVPFFSTGELMHQALPLQKNWSGDCENYVISVLISSFLFGVGRYRLKMKGGQKSVCIY